MEYDNELDILVQEFNQLQKKMDSIYKRISYNSGISDTAFWIIYTVKNEGDMYKQKDLCNMWFYSKQTVNSALKKLVEQNIIQLISVPGNKKDKKVILTEYGKQLANELIEPVNEIEKKSLKNIGKISEFLELYRLYIDTLESETQKIIKKDKERV